MATASETDLTGSTSWSRANFKNSFSRQSRKKKGSRTNSIASSSGDRSARGIDGSPATAADSPYLRRDSTDSSRKLSLRLGGRKRSKIGKTESESGSEIALSRTATDEPPVAEEDSSNYYTEEEDER
jgi:hypothetical protein